MKNFIAEFKKFITRGNVVDMAVGVTVGSAFTAVVNGFTNNVIKPIINYVIALIVGEGALTDAFTFLKKAYVAVVDEAGEIIGYTSEIDLANSIYIDWGTFINAIINFLLVAFTLFTIVKIINRARDNNEKLNKKLKSKVRIEKADRIELKKRGIKLRDKAAVDAYFAEKAAIAAEKAEAEKKAAEEKARLEREANPTTEDLLKKIVTLLESK